MVPSVRAGRRAPVRETPPEWTRSLPRSLPFQFGRWTHGEGTLAGWSGDACARPPNPYRAGTAAHLEPHAVRAAGPAARRRLLRLRGGLAVRQRRVDHHV